MVNDKWFAKAIARGAMIRIVVRQFGKLGGVHIAGEVVHWELVEDLRVFCSPLLRTDSEVQRNDSKARPRETAVHILSSRRRGDGENSPSRDGLEASAGRCKLRFIIADVG